MTNTTTSSGVGVVSLASKLIRFLLILPLVALLQPGDNSWGCIAFQNHLTRKGYPRTDHFRFDQQPTATSTERRLPKDASLGAFTSNTYHFWSNTHKHRRSTSRMAAKESEDDDEIAEVESKRVKAEAEAKRLMKEAQKAAKLKAEQDEKLKEAQEMLAALQAEAETRKKAEAEATKQQAEAEEKRKQAEEEAAKLKAQAEEKTRVKAQKKAEEEAAKKKAEAAEKKKAEELATLLKAKEEAARVMAEIDAKLQAQTADADKEEAERVQKLQSEADQMLELDDESDAMLKKMMEEMEKVSKELESRLMAEAEEAESKFKAEEEEAAKMKKAKEEAAAKAEKEEKEEKGSDKEADLMDRIKSGASFEPAAKTVAAENVKEIPFYSKPKEADEIIDTTATASKTAEKQKPMPMPDLSPSSKKKPEAKKPEAKKKAPEKPKWMKDWKQDEKPKAGEDTVEKKKDETAKAEKDKEEPAKDEPEKKISDPRTKGRSRKENLFDVIGRTATGGVTMDDITKRKQQKPEGTSKRPSPEKLSELKKKGPPSSFGESVAASYKTGQSENQGQRRPMPDLQNMKELKKKGPPASFGSFAQAASSKGSSPTASDNDTIDTLDKGPPASFGASVAMASSGEVPKDLLSRGTASTDAGASPPPQTPSSPSRKRGPDSNIIDVVDVEYTKKDDLTKKKDPIMGSARPLEVEKTVPQAPPLQVEKTVPPMKDPPKKEDKKAPVAEAKGSSTANPVKNIGKAVVDNVFGKKKPEAEKDPEPKTATKATDDDKAGEKAMEDRVAELLKEAFSLSKEDSRVADLLQGVVAITTGKDDKKKKKKKEDKTSAKKASAKGRKRARQVAAEEEIEEEEEEDFDDDEIDEDDYDDDYEDEDDEEDLDDEYDEEEEEEEDTVIMGRGMGRNRRMEDRNDFRRDPNRRGPPNAGMGNRWGGGGRFDDGEYFVDDDNEYMEYDENDRWRGRGPGSGRPEPGGYSVRPPPSSQSRDRQGYETDDDYYFLQFGSPGGPSSRYDEPRGSRYDEPRGDRYYDDNYYDDEYDGPQPGAPRPAYYEPEEEVPKGPPSSFGNFVADASMAKTGYAPTTLKDEKVGGSGINGNGSSSGQDEWGEEMSQNTGGMMSPRGVNGSGKGGGQARPSQPFVVSEDQSGGGRGRKKGPPASFGNSVAAAGEQQTGNPSRSIEEEIANGGMATPTGGMATPRRKTPANPATGAGGGAAQGTGKKPLFIVSEEEAGPADFGSSVAEASGARTGWAPKAPKRASGGLEGGTTGGMRPKIKKKPSPQNPETQKKEFGDSVFDDCPPVESKRKSKSEAEKPLSRKQQIGTNPNQKHSRNPAVNLVDGGASKEPKRPVQFSGSMMAPRIRRKAPPQPDETEDEGKAQ